MNLGPNHGPVQLGSDSNQGSELNLTIAILTATKPKVSASERDNEDKMSTLGSRMSGEWVSRKQRIGVCAYAMMSVTVSRVNYYQLNRVYSIESCVFM
jgi:hypothetical protein